MPPGNKFLYNWSWSHDQDGRHVFEKKQKKKPLKIFFRTISQMTFKRGTKGT